MSNRQCGSAVRAAAARHRSRSGPPRLDRGRRIACLLEQPVRVSGLAQGLEIDLRDLYDCLGPGKDAQLAQDF